MNHEIFQYTPDGKVGYPKTENELHLATKSVGVVAGIMVIGGLATVGHGQASSSAERTDYHSTITKISRDVDTVIPSLSQNQQKEKSVFIEQVSKELATLISSGQIDKAKNLYESKSQEISSAGRDLNQQSLGAAVKKEVQMSASQNTPKNCNTECKVGWSIAAVGAAIGTIKLGLWALWKSDEGMNIIQKNEDLYRKRGPWGSRKYKRSSAL